MIIEWKKANGCYHAYQHKQSKLKSMPSQCTHITVNTPRTVRIRVISKSLCAWANYICN